MATLINIGLCAIYIYVYVNSYLIGKRYKKLRNYTFWVEQSLLQYRPETYIPEWRKQQREKDRQKNRPDRNNTQAPYIKGNETTCLNKLLSDSLRF